MGLLKTKKELKAEGKLTTESMDNDSAEDKIQSTQPVLPIGRQWKLAHAPSENSNCSFYHGEKVVQLELIDGIYTIPEKIEGHEKIETIDMLIKAGFVELNSESIVPVLPSKNKKWKFIHPDHSDIEPINGEYILKMPNDDVIKLKIVNSIVIAESKEIGDMLSQVGFKFLKVEEE